MFGYVSPDEYNLYVKDVALYKALYCGLCKSIGKKCDHVSRISVSFDMTFLSALLHNTEGVDISVKKEHCIVHPITKRPVAKPDDLSETLAGLNVLLTYHKLLDDKVDEKKGAFGRMAFRRAYKKTKRDLFEQDKIIAEEYATLSSLEKKGESGFDVIADPFARMLSRLVGSLSLKNPSEALLNFCYTVGKWIYLADALDDFDKDKKKGLYNAFLHSYPEVSSKKTLLEEKKEDLFFLFTSILTQMQEEYQKLTFHFNHDLLDNIVYKGIPKKTEKLFQKE